MEMHSNSITKTRIYWLILFRFVIVALCLIAHFFLDYGQKVNTLNIFVLTAALIINVLFLIVTPYVRHSWSLFAIVQIMTDLFIETILVYVTGGILSAFVILYFVSVLYAGLFVSLRVSIFCASFAITGISISVIIYYISILHSSYLPIFNIFPPISFPQENDLNFCRAYLFAQGISFYLIAFFSGRLTDIRYRERILHKEILEHLVDGVLVVDNKNCVNYINQRAKKMLGLSFSKNYSNDSILKLLNYDIHLNLLKGILMHRALEYQVTWEYANKKIPLRVDITPITINKAKASIVILKDISLQKRMEATIKVAERLSIVNETATMIAHEIRNPLASILGASQELQRKFSSEDSAKILFDIMVKESQRINSIVDDFLRFSKLRQPNFQICEVGNILEEVVLLLNQRDQYTQIQVQREEELLIKGDSGHLKQLFYNLGINSIEAQENQNSNLIEVMAKPCVFGDFCDTHRTLHGFHYEEETAGIQVSFCDKGKGIDPKLTTKIFKPFFTTKSGGSGIGLAIVQQILESHRAAYYVKSTLGKGTDFVVFFPVEN
ncbi:two-component system sensor histidine kinase NtrB [Candidatus Uabimicrobium amorphum]|uniref:histidine kinase n=1 Tax=Uabimicrobium amorphum TaxID=2596890 RepID=A0A5S9IV12_UABAM|nr:ATP-binding protein [Candidatus Uabimicrobium amorphum]BBM88106.1 PAS domain-containing sensor histidine kinase [Candidatus Uabimicrobium amorphum]